jgi:selT/selW/selH-like putative selenoprotein
LQATLKKKFGVDANLIAGHGGTFLVKVDGRVVFDKHATGRFPEEQEVVEGIEKLAE